MTSDAPDEGGRTRYESVVETMPDGVFVLDRTGTLVLVNDALEAFVGIDRERLVGAGLERLVEGGLFDAGTYERFGEAFAAVRAGDMQERRITLETTGGEVLEVRLSAVEGEQLTGEVVGTVRDVTERERAFEAVERQRRAIARLYETDVDSDLSFGEKIDRALEIGCEFLDLPIGFMSTIDGETQRYEHVVGFEGLKDSSRSLERSYCRQTITSDDPVAIQDAEAELGSEEPAYADTGISCYIGTKITVNGGLHGTFCFAAADARDRSFSSMEREFVRLLGLWAGHNLERQRFEDVLRDLHRVSQALLLADTKPAVARTAVDAAESLFGLPVTACWRYDETTDTLEPLADTEEGRSTVGPAPSFERGEALAWESFDTGEIQVYEDIASETDAHNPNTRLRSEIHVPLGRQGILVTGSTKPQSFGNIDVESLRLLGDLLRDALIDVEQQETLADRGEALQRQNEQLEEFARVVAHDLRNPLAGAVGFLEIARETHDESHFDRVERSLDRMDDLIGELLAIARESRQAVDPRELSLSDVVEEAWSYVDARSATLAVPEDLGAINADETRLLQLFGNLFRNSVEHGSTSSRPEADDSVEHGSADCDESGVTIEVGRLDSGTGFYVQDDGPGLPEGAREDVLTIGRTHSETDGGDGIGLDSVTDIIDAHGWTLSIPETDGGARFEIETANAERTETVINGVDTDQGDGVDG